MVNLVCRSYFIVNCEVSSTVVNPRLGILMSAKLAIPAMHHFLFIEYKICFFSGFAHNATLD